MCKKPYSLFITFDAYLIRYGVRELLKISVTKFSRLKQYFSFIETIPYYSEIKVDIPKMVINMN